MKQVLITAVTLLGMITSYAKQEFHPFINSQLLPIDLFKIVGNSFHEPTPVWLTTTTTGGNPSRRTGTFAASSELGTAGTYVMNIIYTGQAFHCTTTFTPYNTAHTGVPVGSTYILQSNCEKTLFDGQWRAISGTGIYQDLEANGSIVMMPGHEMVTGRLF